MNLNLNDPGLPAPGELAMSASSRSRSGQWPHSPRHERNPSLGELHQELEYEQEGQVVRLLPPSLVYKVRRARKTLGDIS